MGKKKKDKEINPLDKYIDGFLDHIRSGAAKGSERDRQFLEKYIKDRFPYKTNDDGTLAVIEINNEKYAVLKPKN